MKIKPTQDRVVVQAIDPERKTKTGIILPEQAMEKPQHGRVAAVGPEVDALELGAQVLYSKYGGTEIELNGETVILLRQVDILAVVDEDEPAAVGQPGAEAVPVGGDAE
jgi:chaperonin GroES